MSCLPSTTVLFIIVFYLSLFNLLPAHSPTYPCSFPSLSLFFPLLCRWLLSVLAHSSCLELMANYMVINVPFPTYLPHSAVPLSEGVGGVPSCWRGSLPITPQNYKKYFTRTSLFLYNDPFLLKSRYRHHIHSKRMAEHALLLFFCNLVI